MRFLMYTLGDDSKPVPPPTPELMAEMGKFMTEATKAGALLATGGMGPIADGVTLKLSDGKFSMTDGPYAEVKEALGGYFLFECDSLDAALDWAARIPAAEHGAVEVRPVHLDPEEVQL